MKAIITGATSGIGEAVARGLIERGYEATLVGRSDERLRASAARMGGDVHIERADFADLAQVRELADRLEPADVVVNSAAVIAPDAVRTVTINHLAPFVLLTRLAERFGPARFIVLGADPVYLSERPVDLEDLFAPGDPFAVYGRTKNMNAMFVYEFARRAPQHEVNGAHPGIIGGTGLSGETPGLKEQVHARYGIDEASLPNAEAGADTPLWLATEGTGTGRFYVGREPVTTAPHTTDPERCARLWELTERSTR